ncbi:maternal protein exuperantia [Planococcus citri]|uniref:maternal protein exuperantia n=1 Tax=Planococcus citri TaxID=170843 RepID=UPI0031F8A356
MVESNLDNGASPQKTEESVNVVGDVPLDEYCLVGWDLDTTGRKLLDEICHIAGYTPNSDFSLYIMPHGDLTSVAKKRHMIRIVTVGFYRIIKDTTSNKMLKTKSEVSALIEFLDWLEHVNEESAKKGVLLICHESYKFNPHLLIKSLLKYDLLDRFSKIVKGFVDCHTFAKEKCKQTMVSFSIRILSKVLLDKDNVEIHRASDRAHLAYDIVQHLCAGASEIGSGAASPNLEIVKTVLPFTTGVESELKVLQELQVVLRRQHTLKPIFAQFLGFNSTTYQERRNALQLRKCLVDAYVDYDMLQTAWSKGREALEELINDKLTGDEMTDKNKSELVKLLVDHFEKPDEPKKKSRFGRRSSSKVSPKSNESNESESKVGVAECENNPTDVDSELSKLTINNDIITPVHSETNAVKVN